MLIQQVTIPLKYSHQRETSLTQRRVTLRRLLPAGSSCLQQGQDSLQLKSQVISPRVLWPVSYKRPSHLFRVDQSEHTLHFVACLLIIKHATKIHLHHSSTNWLLSYLQCLPTLIPTKTFTLLCMLIIYK